MSSSRVYTVSLKDRNEVVDSKKLASFKEIYLEGDEFKDRISELFLLDLYIYDLEFGVSPLEIIKEIKALENGGSNSFTKPPTQFNRLPLKGLWHKHFFSAHFAIQNIQIQLGKNGLDNAIAKAAESISNGISKNDAISALTQEILEKPLNDRSDNKKVTGEWIVYSTYNNENYYLCLNTHQAGDQEIYNRIVDCALNDFPFLTSTEPFCINT